MPPTHYLSKPGGPGGGGCRIQGPGPAAPPGRREGGGGGCSAPWQSKMVGQGLQGLSLI